MSRIKVTIDRVVLNGIDPTDRYALADALQAELSRALAEPGAGDNWARSGRTPALRLGKMTIEPGASGARRFGGGLARRVLRGAKP
jgi:hypothetical protein